tara:strand:+ start:115 stop:321 length:207 start_codon:yes stop_codon:yes gene_type:complete
MKSFEYAEAHLANVRQEIQRLQQNKVQIDSEIERMAAFLTQAESDIAAEKLAVASTPDANTSTTLPVF